mmetsp:Transcript_67209/g.149090  ORF Transcript_67209/g.149090 Transcript_67209/m.149090 type:complete len:90 (-) Transcript_67209:2-271(-)
MPQKKEGAAVVACFWVLANGRSRPSSAHSPTAASQFRSSLGPARSTTQLGRVMSEVELPGWTNVADIRSPSTDASNSLARGVHKSKPKV